MAASGLATCSAGGLASLALVACLLVPPAAAIRRAALSAADPYSWAEAQLFKIDDEVAAAEDISPYFAALKKPWAGIIFGRGLWDKHKLTQWVENQGLNRKLLSIFKAKVLADRAANKEGAGQNAQVLSDRLGKVIDAWNWAVSVAGDGPHARGNPHIDRAVKELEWTDGMAPKDGGGPTAQVFRNALWAWKQALGEFESASVEQRDADSGHAGLLTEAQNASESAKGKHAASESSGSLVFEWMDKRRTQAQEAYECAKKDARLDHESWGSLDFWWIKLDYILQGWFDGSVDATEVKKLLNEATCDLHKNSLPEKEKDIVRAAFEQAKDAIQSAFELVTKLNAMDIVFSNFCNRAIKVASEARDWKYFAEALRNITDDYPHFEELLQASRSEVKAFKDKHSNNDNEGLVCKGSKKENRKKMAQKKAKRKRRNEKNKITKTMFLTVAADALSRALNQLRTPWLYALAVWK